MHQRRVAPTIGPAGRRTIGTANSIAMKRLARTGGKIVGLEALNQLWRLDGKVVLVTGAATSASPKRLRCNTGRNGIRFNSVQPGGMMTPMLADLAPDD